MATKVPPPRGVAFSFTLPGLVSQADSNVLITDPTIAAGDFKLSKDGGNPANLGSDPTVINSGTMVRISLTGTEMTADDLAITWEDAAGSEWQSGGAVIFTSTRKVDDLTYPNTSGRGIDVDASGGVEVGAVQSAAITADAIAANAIGASELAADAITSSELAASAATEIADAVLSRAVSNVEDTADTHSLSAIILAILESSINGTTWTIRKTDGTSFDVKTVTVNAAADPVTGVT